MLSRDDAIQLVTTLDDAGFTCTLFVDSRHRSYEVQVRLEGADVERLAELRDLAVTVPDAVTTVDSQGYLLIH